MIFIIGGLILSIFIGLIGTWLMQPVLLSAKKESEEIQLETSGQADENPEYYYEDPNEANEKLKRKKFPRLIQPPTLTLSLIVPAYNEEDRLDLMMKETMDFLEARRTNSSDFSYEVLIVDDASKDSTREKATGWVKQYTCDRVRLLVLSENSGKGGAVRKGVLRARGEYILFLDADGATKIQDLKKLENSIKVLQKKTRAAVAVGSRAHLEEKAIAKRHPIRNILMHGFHFIVSSLCVASIRDTQCGFKLFSRKAAQLLFPPLHIERWAFDVELLYVAALLNIPVEEVAVEWNEIPGSKLNVLMGTLTMLRELVLIRLCYTLGVWTPTDGGHRL